MQRNSIVIAGSNIVVPNSAILREVRGSIFQTVDTRFLFTAIFSLVFHVAFMLYLQSVKLKENQTIVIEKIPERFAKLIIDKPIPKWKDENIKQTSQEKKSAADESGQTPESKTPRTATEKTEIQRTAAKKAVAARTARVEQKIRTVGVLGMLTGVGSTAKGPVVYDVLGPRGGKDKHQDLQEALENVTGLQKTREKDILNKKLVKTKDVAVDHRENIDDLLADIGTAKTTDLVKQGNFIIQRPESIEGAASSNAKRDDAAINMVVSSHKTSIKMSYEKFLKRNPTLAGKITVRFTIAASGRITSVIILENTTGNSELENEITRKVKMWRFDEIQEGDATVTYPFVFQPA